MDVFLSWSGLRSRDVAETLAKWLSKHLQAVEPWTSIDIEKGARWGRRIDERLERTRVGIICLTPENLDSKWIHFEAGALSKAKDSYVCTFLLDLTDAEVEFPLAQFQATKIDKEDISQLLHHINHQVERANEKPLPDTLLAEIIDESWPQLEKKLHGVAASRPESKLPARPQEAILDELLTTVRRIERRQSASAQDYLDRMRPDETWREMIAHEAQLKTASTGRIEDILEDLRELLAAKATELKSETS